MAEPDTVLAAARAATDRLAAALGYDSAQGLLRYLPGLVAEAEQRLAEQDATIERLRLQILDDTKNANMTEVPLPEHEEARDG